MTDPLVCPRCLSRLPTDATFCPRCGLSDAAAAAADTAPLPLRVDGRTYHVGARLEIGSVATTYLCDYPEPATSVTRLGTLKVARESANNPLLLQEARALQHLAQVSAEIAPFIPHRIDAFDYVTPGEPPRRANLLGFDPAIASPDELYTLEELRSAYPAGLHPRDMAWIWRRLLTVLGLAHTAGVVHGAVFPMHVLVEPADHKLVLIDWCGARLSSDPAAIETRLAGSYFAWTSRDGSPLRPAPATDIALAARCMLLLLGGDGTPASLPAGIDASIVRHLDRCTRPLDSSPAIARQLLTQFDVLIEALWGPRTFRPLTLPAKRRG